MVLEPCWDLVGEILWVLAWKVLREREKKKEVYCDAMIARMKPGMGMCSHCRGLYHGKDDVLIWGS